MIMASACNYAEGGREPAAIWEECRPAAAIVCCVLAAAVEMYLSEGFFSQTGSVCSKRYDQHLQRERKKGKEKPLFY